MRVSVVIPTSRPLVQVEDLFSALAKQTYVLHEVLCVQQYIETEHEFILQEQQYRDMAERYSLSLRLISPQNSRLSFRAGVSQVRNV